MKHHLAAAFVLILSALPVLAANNFLVKDGQPRAEIVIAETPPRSTRLAAHELRRQVEKITGARLSIVTAPTGKFPVRILVGRSPHTDKLKITADGLRYGAYRIVSGEDWLVLIGDDTNFTPLEPWARNNDYVKTGKLQNSWNKITGEKWGVPNPGLYRNLLRLAGDTGLPDSAKPAGKLPPLELWDFDERGSFNAVCGFLRRLGVRWYLPGPLGEVVPSLTSIPLPKIDQTVRPDFPLRRVNLPFAVVGEDTALWAMRIGLRNPHDIQQAHGLETMTHQPAILKEHPDWFALYGGKRNVQPGLELHQLCYSSEDLFQHTVRYVRAQFDHFKEDMVSVMPPDGYTALCQCKLCEGRDTPQRDDSGRLSDYVWDFVNRVAREVRKTHPHKKVLCCAYGVYTLPPLKIDKLEPNVVVSIVGGRRPVSHQPKQQQEECRKLRDAWAAKTHHPLIIFENYPFTDRGWYLPSFTAHELGDGIKATQGVSQGEDISLTLMWPPNNAGMGLNHFLVYFTARSYWGGPKQNAGELLREYCKLFYGPAATEMHAFFTYCESNWHGMEKDQTKAERALELFAAAQARADAASTFGKRLAIIDEFLKSLRRKRIQLAQKRGPVPVLRLVGEAHGKIVIDGKLDEEVWQKCPISATGTLAEIQTGMLPIFPTTFKSAWIGNDLYFAIRCDERPGQKLNIGTTRNKDQGTWFGDVVEILLATESHSYYQIVVNPSGARIDLDRAAARNAWFTWDSQAEVATHVADDHWTIEIRIPVTKDENDPLHQVIGRHPTRSLPWHVNICRQRIRDNGSEYSAFAPTATDGFHEPMKFAHFYDGNSFEFEADSTVTDFVIASRAAQDLMRKRKHAEALKAFLDLADKGTDLQKSVALAQAAGCACSLEKFVLATKIAERIPIKSVARTAEMHNLLAQRRAPDLIARFGKEDIGAWPFWQLGEGYSARGQAYAIIAAGRRAESDFRQALEWTSDPRARQRIALALGNNRESVLKDDEGAFAAYRQIVKPRTQLGGADEFNAVQGMARILTRQGKFDDALTTLSIVDIDKLRGHWRGSMLLALGDTFTAAGRFAEATKAYRAVLADDSTDAPHRKTATMRLEGKK